MTTKKVTQKPKKKIVSSKETILTKEDFLRLLDKAIQPLPPQKKQPVKGKSKTSE